MPAHCVGPGRSRCQGCERGEKRSNPSFLTRAFEDDGLLARSLARRYCEVDVGALVHILYSAVRDAETSSLLAPALSYFSTHANLDKK